MSKTGTIQEKSRRISRFIKNARVFYRSGWKMGYNVEVNIELMTKAERIKNARRETKERRKTQRVFVYQLKLQNLSKRKIALLERAFLEAKWFYNWLVSDTNRLDMPVHKVKTVEVKVGDHYEQRELTVLGSQIKQEIANRIKDNLRALGQLKRNGHSVGAPKHKSFVNSIPLVQYGKTHKLDFDRKKNKNSDFGCVSRTGVAPDTRRCRDCERGAGTKTVGLLSPCDLLPFQRPLRTRR